MKNFKNYTPEKFSKPDFPKIEEGIYKTKCPYETIFNGDIFVTSLSVEIRGIAEKTESYE